MLVLHADVILHLHVRARASPYHLHEHLHAFVYVRMNCSHIRTNLHMFIHITRMNYSSPLTHVGKITSRTSATNGEANDATNDEVNM